MDYLDHLGRVTDKKQRQEDIANLEHVLGFQLPKLLKTFYLMYQVNDCIKYKKGYHIDYNFLVWNDLRKYSTTMALFVSEYKELGYDPETFYEFNDIKSVLRDIFNDDYERYEKDFIMIGETSWHFPLMLGINVQNTDNVFVYDMDNRELKFLANDIFEYLMNIELDFSNNYNLPEGKTVNDLYKNWGEDFWRVRENEKTDV